MELENILDIIKNKNRLQQLGRLNEFGLKM